MIHPVTEADIKRILERVGTDLPVLSGRTVLITGASGLIGGYLVETLAFLNRTKKLRRPCIIIALQRHSITRKHRLGYLLNRPDVQFVSHDASTPYAPSSRVDYLVHSAGMSSPAFFLTRPIDTIDVNVNGVRWILEYAKTYKSKSVLYMSSGEIYGNPPPDKIPTPESYAGNTSPLDSRACYTASKRLSETLCVIYNKQYGVPVKIARPFLIYGPGLDMTDRRVMADFIRNGLSGKPIEMLNAGCDKRSYCYVADATVAFLQLLLSHRDGEVFNVGSDREEVSIHDLATLVHMICHIDAPIRIKEQKTNYTQGAPNRVLPDISKLKTVFRYRPEVDIREGLKRTIAWNRDRFVV